jgi:hypothetical protein
MCEVRRTDFVMRTRRRMRALGILAMALGLVTQGCSMADTSAAEAEVAKFHAALGDSRSGEIYAAATEEFTSKATEQQFTELLDAVNRKLGKVKTTQLSSWKVNYVTSGHYVVLVYRTTYEQGEADEQFIYRMQQKDARLVGYHINSNTFIIK